MASWSDGTTASLTVKENKFTCMGADYSMVVNNNEVYFCWGEGTTQTLD
jgi:hypothetical protein